MALLLPSFNRWSRWRLRWRPREASQLSESGFARMLEDQSFEEASKLPCTWSPVGRTALFDPNGHRLLPGEWTRVQGMGGVEKLFLEDRSLKGATDHLFQILTIKNRS